MRKFVLHSMAVAIGIWLLGTTQACAGSRDGDGRPVDGRSRRTGSPDAECFSLLPTTLNGFTISSDADDQTRSDGGRGSRIGPDPARIAGALSVQAVCTGS